MKIKSAKICLLLIIALGVILLLCSCSRVVVINGIHMKDDSVIEMAVGDFSYEGKKVVVVYAGGDTKEVDLTEDMIPEAERLKFFKMGEQEVKVVYDGTYVTTMKINVSRHEFDDIYALEGYTCVYDGQPHRVTLNHDLPEGATIEYTYGNTFTNAGTYNVVGVISKEGYVSKTLSTQLVIEKADYDTSALTFESNSFVYDGTVKQIEAQNVPENVNVTYSVYAGNIQISNAVNAGTYRVVARFENLNSNFNTIAPKQATLTIEKADYDMSAVSFTDKEKTYDGQNFVPSLDASSVLPTGVSVSFACYDADGNPVSSNAYAGEYIMVARYASNSQNYNAIPDMQAKLVVNKRVIALGDDVLFDDKTADFDSQVHSVSISGELPTGVFVTYENNDQTYAGEYEVVAHFNAENPNETVDVQELTAYLIINSVHGSLKVDGHTVSASDLVYDKEAYEMSIAGLDTDAYRITSFAFYLDGEDNRRIVWGDPDDALVPGTTYNYAIEFAYIDENLAKSISLPMASGTYTYDEILLEDKVVTYDGTAKTIEAQNVSQGTHAKYEIYSAGTKVEEAINAGEYLVKAFVLRDESERVLYELSATLTINKYEYDMSGVTFENKVEIYDGTQKTIAAQDVPTGVEVRYEYKQNGETVSTEGVVNAGEYTVVAHFVVDLANYVAIGDMQATLTINKATVNATLSDKKWKDNGEPYYPGLEDGYFIPYGVSYEIVTTKDGVQVDYCDGPGVYTVEAHFTIDEDNVNPQEDLSATIRIYTIKLEGVVVFEDRELSFDTNSWGITAQNVPSGVNVTYEYYKGDEFISNYKVKYAGVYTVIAHFTPTNSNNVLDVDEMRATLTITHLTYDIKRQVLKRDIEPTDFWYNPETKSINFKLPSTFFVVKRIYIHDTNDWHEIMFGPMSEGFSNDNGQAYHYIVEFDYITDDEDFRASADVGRKDGYFTYEQITKGNLKKISNFIYMKDKTVTYDGEIHTNEYQEVPNRVWNRDEVTVTYEYLDSNNNVVSTTGVSAVGTYRVVAHIVANDPTATLEVDEMRAWLTIEEA